MNQVLEIDLPSWRAKWEAMEREELRINKEADETMTIEQSARIYLELCTLGESQLKATEKLFRPERMDYLADLQAKLQRFGRWWKLHHGSVTPSV